MKMRILYAFLSLTMAVLPNNAESGPIPADNDIGFEIRRDGSAFGSHSLSFGRDDSGRRIVEINIEMEYCLGPLCLFTYKHDNREIWQDGNIAGFRSKTDDNGDRYKVQAKWRNNKVSMKVNGDKRIAPGGAVPTTYWREDMLKADKLINTQNGKVHDIAILEQGQGTYNVAGEMRKARHYVIKTDRRVNIWYDAATAQWVGLEFQARGSTISYHRNSAIKQDGQ